jgi:HEPN domain-containing protein
MKERILEEAERLFKTAKPIPIVAAYQAEQMAIKANLERLKAERLVRESPMAITCSCTL